METKTTWSNNGKKKTIPELQDCFIEIFKLTKHWHVPHKPTMTDPQKIEIPISGTLLNAVKDLDQKEKSKDIDSNKYAHK